MIKPHTVQQALSVSTYCTCMHRGMWIKANIQLKKYIVICYELAKWVRVILNIMEARITFSQLAWKGSVFQSTELKAMSITLWQATKQLNEKHMNKATLELWRKGRQATWFDKKITFKFVFMGNLIAEESMFSLKCIHFPGILDELPRC